MQLVPRGAGRSAATIRPGVTGPDSSEGFHAHRDFLSAALGLSPATPAGRRPDLVLPPLLPLPARTSLQSPEHLELWNAAVAAHRHLAGVGEPEAQTELLALVEHLERAGRLAWASDPGLFAVAVEETLRYSVFDARVGSHAAQRAWRRWWSEQPYGPTVGDRDAVTLVRNGADRERVLRSDWAAAWALWAARTRVAAGRGGAYPR